MTVGHAAERVAKGVVYDGSGRVVKCLFCRIHSREEPGNIAYEDDGFVAFHTIAPASSLHLLITPRQHVQNVAELKGKEGADLVEELVRVGRLALGSRADGARFCFHVPPFNSIDHLHLHAIADPASISWAGFLKYGFNRWWCHSAEDVIRRLRSEASPSARSVSPQAPPGSGSAN